MRITSELFISALLRRLAGEGGFGAVLRRGNREAGVIFLLERRRDGMLELYGPAPQAAYAPGGTSDRNFVLVDASLDDARLASWIERQQRFDPDLWLVEIEPGRLRLGEMVTLITGAKEERSQFR